MAPRNSHWSGRAGRGRLKLAISPGGGRSRRRTTEGGSSTMPQITKEDVCYLKHGERQIMARVFKPEGSGPFPVYVDLHGGAWNNGDLNDRTGLGEYLAERGVVMVTLNFRHGPDGYPTTLQDINYGVRWGKAHPEGGFPGNEPERFVSNYRKAGGDIEITYFDNAKRNTEVSHQPAYEFLRKHLK